MVARYLIGKGELLTYSIDAPKKKPGEKAHPYTLAEARRALLPQIDSANQSFARLPDAACPDDLAVAMVTLHPAYLAKSYFPRHLLQAAGLQHLGSRTQRVRPRKKASTKAPSESDTTQLFVAGRRSILRNLDAYARTLEPGTREGMEFSQIESIAPMSPVDRIRLGSTSGVHVFEVGLHVPAGEDPGQLRAIFAKYAQTCGFVVNPAFDFQAGQLLFLPVEGPQEHLERLALFTLMRVIREMPRLRAARPLTRSTPVAVSFDLPAGEPLSREPRVAVLDGGLPDAHVLGDYVRRYFLSDEDADDVDPYLAHGLGVTSALLFGPIEPGSQAHRPYATVDHHRVLDAKSDEEDPYELYRTLGHVETVLLSRSYQFVNLSLGPDLCVEDNDVHAWTAVIDDILSDGETLMSVAIGNNGENDAEAGLNRIQVPADSVNALSVGAVNRTSSNWSKSSYSAVGPGRSPGRRKPDLVAFGGSPHEYFHVVAPGNRRDLVATLGTSFAAPFALRTAVGISAILGSAIAPLTIKALMIHGCETQEGESVDSVGWGMVPIDLNTLITCGDGVARIIYQGELRPGKFLRAPVPLPLAPLEGKVTLSATFCYASPVDPQDSSAYTKAGLGITFRPHVDKRKPGAQHATPQSFFPANEWRTEAELRADLHKWETVLHAEHSFRGASLKESVFDVHYNARDAGGVASGAERIRYALVVTVRAPKHANLYQDILNTHTVLQALEPQVTLPLRS
ncbi:S8 family peptidase [Burkholderia sp. Tr-20390]|nr:S8 family peptidase [Burkholderia sp. Tr-20390]